MGDVLRNEVNFRSLAGIRRAYHSAFSQQHARIDEVLDETVLQYSAAVRNVLIHKGGKVDAEYREQVAGVPEAIRPEVGQPLPISGKLTAELIGGLVGNSQKLIRAVDAWILGHPEDSDERKSPVSNS